MTGPEHYRMAEALLKVADEGSVDWESTVATAQVHATLALTAATAMNDGDFGLGIKDYTAWRRVASVNPPADGEMQP